MSPGTFNTSVVGSVHMDPVIIGGYPPVSAYYSQPQSTSFALNTRPITVASTAVPVSSSSSIGPNDQGINEILNAHYTFTTPSQTVKANDELSHNVAHCIKQKIIAGEYIDLAVLLTNSKTTADEKYKLVFMQGELLIQPKQQQITNISLWTDAFLIYFNIYCRGHPQKI